MTIASQKSADECIKSSRELSPEETALRDAARRSVCGVSASVRSDR